MNGCELKLVERIAFQIASEMGELSNDRCQVKVKCVTVQYRYGYTRCIVKTTWSKITHNDSFNKALIQAHTAY